jgi:OOP family OmpA-OmpF porin
MKRNLLTAVLMVIIGVFLVSCAGQTVKKTSPAFAPYKFSANQYAPKVNSFVVILDNSTSMTDKYGAKTKQEISKNLLDAINQSLPDLNYQAELITFGPKNKINIGYKLAQYSTSAFGAAINAVKNPSGGSNVPLANSFTATGTQSVQGSVAVIVISDGELMNKVPLKAAAALKKQLGNRLCIYTVLLGDDAPGKKVMADLAKAGACGYATTANDLAAPGKLAAFVEGIFLTKATPKPVVKPVAAAPMDSDGDGVIDAKDKCPNTPKGAKVNAEGCWVYNAEVLFGFDSTEITSDAFPMLDEAASVMQLNPNLKVEIDGHTDSTGPAAYNMSLSQKRANAVMKYFVDKGVDAKRLTAKGFGLTQPIAGNDTKEGRAKNRRVELKPVK